MMSRFAAQYAEAGATGAVAAADSHGLISMMFKGAIENIALAKASIGRGDIVAKVHAISRAIDVIEALQLALDHKQGGQIADGLEQLYNWITECLVKANLDNDVDLLDESVNLIETIRAAWDQIPEEIRKGNLAAVAA